jgi:hypothetical protein
MTMLNEGATFEVLMFDNAAAAEEVDEGAEEGTAGADENGEDMFELILVLAFNCP